MSENGSWACRNKIIDEDLVGEMPVREIKPLIVLT
jgi:hypothetical protein